MQSDYANVDDEQVIINTGHALVHWTQVLDRFSAATQTSNDVVAHLQEQHGVPRYWARTLTTRYMKSHG